MTSGFRRAAPFALMLSVAAGPARAADELVFHPCLTEREQAFLEVELKRGPAPHPTNGVTTSGWEYAVVDLDADGAPEVAVRSGEPCEGVACRTTIYTRVAQGWVSIFESADRDISVARRVTLGYREILTSAGLYRWSGKAYRPVT